MKMPLCEASPCVWSVNTMATSCASIHSRGLILDQSLAHSAAANAYPISSIFLWSLSHRHSALLLSICIISLTDLLFSPIVLRLHRFRAKHKPLSSLQFQQQRKRSTPRLFTNCHVTFGLTHNQTDIQWIIIFYHRKHGTSVMTRRL